VLEVRVRDPQETDVLFKLSDVHKHFHQRRHLPWSRGGKPVRAVDGISFEIRRNETMSLVGESGCGKTTTARMVLLLESQTAGRITFRGQEIGTLRGEALREYRAGVQAVFQDPWSSLNPRQNARAIIAEPLIINRQMTRGELAETVDALLTAVGLNVAVANYMPHELSGGMRQRLAIARAISLNPSAVVLDEPVSALDVSIRAQIMNLLKDLQDRLGVAYLLIAHNMATVRYLSHRMAVMYVGRIVEAGVSEDLFTAPLHPYTQALISAAAANQPGSAQDQIILTGDTPSPANPPSGCRFHPRCPKALARCSAEVPELQEMATGHFVACHLY
jgi:oligopeptide/dipeptide ABC transporter ATP-binding protein